MRRERPIIDMWVVNIRDDRGQLRACRMITSPFGAKSIGADLTRAELQSFKAAASRAFMGPSALLGAGMGLTFILWKSVVSRHLSPPWVADVSVFAIIPVIWLIWDLTVLGPRVRPRYAKDHRRTALELHRCPWCLYRLPLNPGADGMTVCPECGGVWRPLGDQTPPSGG